MKTTTVFDKLRIVGNTYTATAEAEKKKILKNYKNGGGILGGYLKAGDKVLILSAMNDIDTLSFSTDITLHRLSEGYFYSDFYFIKD